MAANKSDVGAIREGERGIVCKGSWLLGTACGHCAKCAEGAPHAIASLRAELRKLQPRDAAIGQQIPPIVCELFKLLPAPGEGWPVAERVKWLRALEACFQVTYKCDGQISFIEKGAP